MRWNLATVTMLTMGICERCRFDWSLPATALTVEIGQIGLRYRQHLEGLHRKLGESGLRARPSDGVWSPLEYTAHMRDVAHFYLDRIQRIITEDRPQLPAVGFAALAESRRYNDQDINEVLEALNHAASAASALLETLTATQWARVGLGSDGDERDVLTLARRLATRATSTSSTSLPVIGRRQPICEALRRRPHWTSKA